MAPTLDDIAGLRRGRGVTMISSKFPQKDTSCKRLSSKHCTGPQSIIHTHNMTTVAMGNTTTSLTDQLSANITDKLPSCSVDTLSCRESPCYSNWQNGGSSLRLLIRERLSSPKCRSRAPLMSIPRLSSSIISLLCIILCASSTLGSEAPLSKTDATKMSQFRTFNGRGMYSDYSSGPDRNYLGGEAVMMRSIAPQKVSEATVLNFQTLRSIKKWGNTKDILLVSGRDYVYMLNAAQFSNNGEIRYIERLRWVSDVKTQDRCLQMSKQKYECNNFIRVIELLVNGTLMVCGTNSYFPRCRYYTRQQFNATSSTMDSSFTREVTCEGLGDCQTPYNPTSSSANLYTKTDHGYQLFTAVIKDFMGKEPVLMRKQRYVYSMDNWLNDPSFIQLVEYGEKIYLFFRETATKEETGTGSPQTYARIAQVCKDDAGGTTLLKNQWTTFLKARLTCTIPGKESFTFNNLTSVSNVTEIQGENGELIDVIFATFTTPWDWNLMPMSAVCVYSLRDSIEDLFSTGRFYGLQDFESKPQQMSPNMRSVGYPFESETVTKSIPLPDNQVPNPRPGSCHAAMSDKALYFAKNYPLMYDSVDPLYNDPVFVSSNGVRLTQIAVDDNAGNSDHLVLYLGTENGNLLRIRPRLDFMHTGPKSVLLEEISLVGEGVCGNQTSECGVQALHISRPTQNGNTRSSSSTQSSVFVAFTDRMAQLPLAACIQYTNSDCCSIDPDCGWLDQKCIARTSDNNLSLLPTKSLRTIPSNCQQLPKPEQPECNDTCNLDTMDEEIFETICVDRFGPMNCSQPVVDAPSHPRKGCNNKNNRGKPLVNTRSLVSRIADVISDQPEVVERCPTAPSSSSKGASDDELMNLFAERVFPSIANDFRSTLEALQTEEQRSALLQQLQETLVTTTQLVIRNHKKEDCLPSKTVNSLTHTYPLLLKEIELWHTTAVKKMSADGFLTRCWDQQLESPCSGRISFSVPLAPSLWKPLSQLMSNFGAQCTSNSHSAEHDHHGHCNGLTDLGLCANEKKTSVNPHCQPKHCRFQRYADVVDVKAFFRHANDSRQFLSESDVLEPLWKPVNVTLSRVEAIRGHLELAVNEVQPFHVEYSPITEKVKIIFYISAVRDCSLNEKSCAGSQHGCNPRLERKINSWFMLMMRKLKPMTKMCTHQVARFRRQSYRTGQQQQQRSRRNSITHSSNQLRAFPIPQRCRYIKKTVAALSPDLWLPLIRRSQRRGGTYSDVFERIEFYDLESIKQFFDNQCSLSEREPRHENLGIRMPKRPIKNGVQKKVDVNIVAQHQMPFVIEQNKLNHKIRLKFFTAVKNSSNNPPAHRG